MDQVRTEPASEPASEPFSKLAMRLMYIGGAKNLFTFRRETQMNVRSWPGKSRRQPLTSFAKFGWYFLFAMLRIPIRLLITNAKR